MTDHSENIAKLREQTGTSLAQSCDVCSGLGFVSHDERELCPEFNIWGLTRRTHPDGRVTWEGDCRVCAIPKEGRMYVPFGWQARGWI